MSCLTCALIVRKSEGVSLSPPAGRLHHLTARTGSHPSGGAQQSEAGGVMTNLQRDLSDGAVRDEVTQRDAAQTGSRQSDGARQSKAGGVMTNFQRDLSDGAVRDEVTQLRSLRKLRFCL